jgi:hypothetical protein
MQTPHPDTYPVIQKKLKFSVTRCFFGHFKVESRVTSVARMYCIQSKRDEAFFGTFQHFLMTIGKSQNH